MTRLPASMGQEPGGDAAAGGGARRVGGPPDPRYLLTVEETAKSLSISRTRVFGLIKAGQLPGLKIGRSTRIPTKCIEELIDRLINDPQLLARF